MANDEIHVLGSRLSSDCAFAESEREMEQEQASLKAAKYCLVCIASQRNRAFEAFLHQCKVERQLSSKGNILRVHNPFLAFHILVNSLSLK